VSLIVVSSLDPLPLVEAAAPRNLRLSVEVRSSAACQRLRPGRDALLRAASL